MIYARNIWSKPIQFIELYICIYIYYIHIIVNEPPGISPQLYFILTQTIKSSWGFLPKRIAITGCASRSRLGCWLRKIQEAGSGRVIPQDVSVPSGNDQHGYRESPFRWVVPLFLRFIFRFAHRQFTGTYVILTKKNH